MKFYIKQKVFSFNDRFSIKDETWEDIYFAEGEFFSFGKKLHIYDKKNRHVLSIEQKLFTFMPEYDLVRDGMTVATVKKQFTFFYPSYAIDGMPITVEGDFFDHTYDIFRDGKTVASIYKEWFTWGDSYALDIRDPADEIHALALVLAIDCAMESDNNN